MLKTLVTCAGIAGLALVLSVAIYVLGRLRMAQQTTLQMLIERGAPDEQLLRSLGPAARRDLDRRRGILLLAVGFAWTTVTFFAGGSAWIAGVFPASLGLAYLLLGVLDGRRG